MVLSRLSCPSASYEVSSRNFKKHSIGNPSPFQLTYPGNNDPQAYSSENAHRIAELEVEMCREEVIDAIDHLSQRTLVSLQSLAIACTPDELDETFIDLSDVLNAPKLRHLYLLGPFAWQGPSFPFVTTLALTGQSWAVSPLLSNLKSMTMLEDLRLIDCVDHISLEELDNIPPPDSIIHLRYLKKLEIECESYHAWKLLRYIRASSLSRIIYKADDGDESVEADEVNDFG
ncbi:hypothetical protein HGRIS_007184 [Hohenbuehelia grisea]|uniref:Uncharacterized protein n=1 Tax=Hohenbuehelia grisea TaxID=104357 RepID=A0ABR3JC26_9AGAR